MFKVSEGLSNIRALQRISNEDHRMRRKKFAMKATCVQISSPADLKSGFDLDISILSYDKIFDMYFVTLKAIYTLKNILCVHNSLKWPFMRCPKRDTFAIHVSTLQHSKFQTLAHKALKITEDLNETILSVNKSSLSPTSHCKLTFCFSSHSLERKIGKMAFLRARFNHRGAIMWNMESTSCRFRKKHHSN